MPMAEPTMPFPAERRVDHALFAELVLEAGGHAEDATHLAHVFAEHHDAIVGAHRDAERVVDGLHHVDERHRRPYP